MSLDAAVKRGQWKGQEESRLHITGLEAGTWSCGEGEGGKSPKASGQGPGQHADKTYVLD